MDYSVLDVWHFPRYCLLNPLVSPKDRKCHLIGSQLTQFVCCLPRRCCHPTFSVGSCHWHSAALYSQLFEASATYVVLRLLPAEQDYCSTGFKLLARLGVPARLHMLHWLQTAGSTVQWNANCESLKWVCGLALCAWRMQTLAETFAQAFLQALLGGKDVQASGPFQ